MSFVFNPFSGTFDAVPLVKAQQVPVETPNGAIVAFTLPNSDTYITGTLQVWLNGILQKATGDYSETSNTKFTFVSAPIAADLILLAYVIS